MTAIRAITRLQDADDITGVAGSGKGWVSNGAGAMVWTDLATQAELDTHTALTTTAHGGIVASSDARLTDSRAPNGAAGGDLAGTFPNPTIGPVKRAQAKLAGLGLLTETVPADAISAVGTTITAGSAYGATVGLVIGDVVSNILIGVQTAGAGTAPTLIRVALADATRKIVATSNDLHASAGWTSTSVMTCPLTTPGAAYTVTATGLFYVVFLQVGAWATTQLKIHGVLNNNALIAGFTPTRAGVYGTGLSDLPAVNSTLAAQSTSGGSVIYAGLT